MSELILMGFGFLIGSAFVYVRLTNQVIERDEKIAELQMRLIKAGIAIPTDFDTSEDYIGSQYGI